MLVKRYLAKDMQQAMDQIIRDLGSDAVILSSRKIRKKGIKNFFKGQVLEVMAAYDPTMIPGAEKTEKAEDLKMLAEKVTEINTDAAIKAAELSREQFDHLDKRIDELDEVLKDFMQKFTHIKRDITFDYSKDIEVLLCTLIENQVREELAHNIAREAETILKKQENVGAFDVMEQVITEYLGPPSPIRIKRFKQKIVLFLGPTGVGKTTSIVKLAADFAINQKKRVGIINTDTYRIAAQEQLKTYADILNIPLSVVYRTEELGDEISAMADREVIFIDTAGKKPVDEKHHEDIKIIIDTCEPEDVLMCIPATVNFASLREIIDSYSYIDNYKLLVTKLDETKYRGMILNLSWYTKKELAYFATGQNVPDDIEQINIEALAGEILGRCV
ncbi:MAG: flagellar biosynthesis protein FlhF [Oscillospiraceae bacterium]|nr:flagellar biosynthesis protein FlhF [Oscillospiraceae bacterium]